MSAIPTQGTTFEKIEIYPLGEEDNLGSAVDLRLGVVHFQYFEDIFSPVITPVVTKTGRLSIDLALQLEKFILE